MVIGDHEPPQREQPVRRSSVAATSAMVLDHAILDIPPGYAEQRRLLQRMIGPANSARGWRDPQDSARKARNSATTQSQRFAREPAEL